MFATASTTPVHFGGHVWGGGRRPALRARLKDRFVELVDVDLRWGITVEEAERGEVLPICLAEIDRSQTRLTSRSRSSPKSRKVLERNMRIERLFINRPHLYKAKMALFE